MEDDKSKDMSDNDRKMAGRFGGESDESHTDDEKDNKKEKKEKDEDKSEKEEKKPPKRSLFGLEKPVEEEKNDQKDEENSERNLFSGLLSNEVEKEETVKNEAEAGEETQEEAPQNPVENGDSLKEDFEEVIIDRLQEIDQELEQSDETNAAEAIADAEFLEHVGERMEEGLTPQEAIDDALEDEFIPPETDAFESDLVNSENFEEQEDSEDDQAPLTTTTTSPPPPPISPPTPPAPPVRTASVPPTPPPPPAALYPPMPSSPNTPSSPNVQPPDPDLEPMNDSYYRRRRSGDLLLGGIVGYMIGRRGGRKRTEARLEPEIEQRDDELNKLKGRLSESEQEVRELAAKRTPAESINYDVENSEPLVQAEKVVEKIEKIPIATIDKEKQIIEKQEKIFEQELVESQPELVSELIEKHIQLEKTEEPKLEKKQAPIEIPGLPEKRPERISELPEVKKDISTMTLPELLEVAEHIMLERTSLRELYELNRIDAVNLRRVVIEYMQGGQSYERILRGSLEAVEMQRELRGEIKRDSAFTSAAKDGSSGATPLQEQMPAASPFSNDKSKLDIEKSTALNLPIEEQQSMISNNAAVALGVFTGIVIMLLVLLFTR